MGQDLTIQNTSLSAEDHDAFFDETIPEKTQIKPEEIIGGERPSDSEMIEVEENVDSNDFFDDEEGEESEEEEVKNKKSEKKEKSSDEDDEIFENPIQDAETEQVFYKAKVDHLIEKGVFYDFEGREDFVYSEENYLQLVEKQAEWKADERYNSKIEKLGDYKVLIDHLEDGGDPDEIIDIFKESQELSKIDTSTVRGKVDYLRYYYIEEEGWTESKFERNAKLWAADENLLNEEFRDAKADMDNIIQRKVQEKRLAVEQYNREQETLKQNFEISINGALKEDEDLTPSDRKIVRDALFKHDHSLADGRMVNKFTYEFMKIQANPKEYLNLIKTVLFKEKVDKVKTQKIETEATKKIWNTIKGNASVRKNSSQKMTRESSEIKDLKVRYK